jgi:hypothetical protein
MRVYTAPVVELKECVKLPWNIDGVISVEQGGLRLVCTDEVDVIIDYERNDQIGLALSYDGKVFMPDENTVDRITVSGNVIWP